MPPSSDVPYDQLLKLANTLADLSGEAILPHFRKSISVDNKAGRGEFDPVTIADRAAENVIREAIQAAYPDHGIVGEEFGMINKGARYTWVIDPIDGTRSFIIGAPMWGTLIGLLDGDQPVLGMINQPYTGERCWSTMSASYLSVPGDASPRHITTRACASLADAFVMTTSPDLFEAGFERDIFEDIKSYARMTRFGGDCYAYLLLASGLIDVVIEAGLKPYDIMAIIPIVERAGGRVTNWAGQPANTGGRILATGDPALHELLLKRLSQ